MDLHQQIFFCLFWLSSFARAEVRSANEIQRLLEENKNNSTALSQLKSALWVNSPTVRGSVEILWTCLVTLVACVYTVLHLNVPSKIGKWSNLLDKLRWVVMAVLMPEIVFVVAAKQLREALALRRALREQLAESTAKSSENIDLEFCFFVAMGGFQVSLEDEGIEPGPAFDSHVRTPSPFTLPLSCEGFLRLAKLGEIDISEAMRTTYVKDRSKANVVQQTLVLIQVSWMAIQCIVRKAQGLLITLLEIHTMVHVICAMAFYGLWVYKPMDISHPEILMSKTDTMRGFLALCLHIQVCVIPGVVFVLGQGNTDARDSDAPAQSGSSRAAPIESGDAVELAAMVQVPGEPGDTEVWFTAVGQTHDPFQVGFIQVDQGPIPPRAPDKVTLAPSDVCRLERAAAFVRRMKRHEGGKAPLIYHPDYQECLTEHGNMMFGLRSRYNDPLAFRAQASIVALGVGSNDDTDSKLAKRQQFVSPSILAWLLSVVYSAIHLLAWNYSFPTSVEHLLWKAASVAVGGSLPVGRLIEIFLNHSRYVKWPSRRRNQLFSLFLFCLLFLQMALSLANAISRVFLTIESFTSLRSLPIGAYAMPAWNGGYQELHGIVRVWLECLSNMTIRMQDVLFEYCN
ncbi:hypothetical protein CSOJ01_05690 [Colletotrichum sojae]|uniref:Uncharacterized protein n=1 Tax=Colletotrichum sojae TaxID=2175907 RepID=A0A8H6JED4_9PEZI|nr:hypothetical protein CSOJ01_05690 [Colletotrichum sojae]